MSNYNANGTCKHCGLRSLKTHNGFTLHHSETCPYGQELEAERQQAIARGCEAGLLAYLAQALVVPNERCLVELPVGTLIYQANEVRRVGEPVHVTVEERSNDSGWYKNERRLWSGNQHFGWIMAITEVEAAVFNFADTETPVANDGADGKLPS